VIGVIRVSSEGDQPIPYVDPTYHDYGTLDVGKKDQSWSFNIENHGGGTVDFQIRTSDPRISVDTSSGSVYNGATWSIGVIIDTPSFSAGRHYKEYIYVDSNVGTETVTIEFDVGSGQPILYVDPTYHDYGTLDVGKKDQSWSFNIENHGGGILEWNIDEGINYYDYVSCYPMSGTVTTGTESVTVTIDTTNLKMNHHYEASIYVHSNGGDAEIVIEFDTKMVLPDLSVVDLWVEPKDPKENQDIKIYFLLSNVGDKNIGKSIPFDTAVFIDDILDTTISIKDEILINHQVAYYYTRSPLSVGKHTIKVIADYSGKLKEWNENNNEKEITIDVLTEREHPPEAYITLISPNPANEGDKIHFKGYGKDDGYIQAYEWRSSIDGYLSSQSEFSTSLSVGVHEISFRVKDNDGLWSDWVSQRVVVKKQVRTIYDLAEEYKQKDEDYYIIDCQYNGKTYYVIDYFNGKMYQGSVVGDSEFKLVSSKDILEKVFLVVEYLKHHFPIDFVNWPDGSPYYPHDIDAISAKLRSKGEEFSEYSNTMNEIADVYQKILDAKNAEEVIKYVSTAIADIGGAIMGLPLVGDATLKFLDTLLLAEVGIEYPQWKTIILNAKISAYRLSDLYLKAGNYYDELADKRSYEVVAQYLCKEDNTGIFSEIYGEWANFFEADKAMSQLLHEDDEKINEIEAKIFEMKDRISYEKARCSIIHKKVNERLSLFDQRVNNARLSQAITSGNIGAHLSIVTANSANDANTHEHSLKQLDIYRPDLNLHTTITDNIIRIDIDSNTSKGTTIIVDIDNSTFSSVDISSIQVLFDGKIIRQANNYSDILNANDESEPEFLIVLGAQGPQILISIPHFSAHTIVITKSTISSLSDLTSYLLVIALAIVLITMSISWIKILSKKKSR